MHKKKVLDAKLQNSRQQRQEYLDRYMKCMDCEMWTLYGKMCKGVCIKD